MRMRGACFFSLVLVFLCAFPVLGAEPLHYDVVVVGAGTGGSMAAVQAGRMGMRVAVVEESDWIGGQMTAAAVSTMDDVGKTRMGLYGEFIKRVREVYAKKGQNVNICLWGGDTIATEPIVGQSVLLTMMREAGSVDVFTSVHLKKAEMDKGRVVALQGTRDKKDFRIMGKVFIEATERGDLLPLIGARYRSGNSISPTMKDLSRIQDITYVAVIKEYPDGLPDSLRLKKQPPLYETYVPRFRATVTKDGNTFPAPFPLDVASHNAYRAIPNPENPAKIVGDESETWGLISKTSLNSANDYLGLGKVDAGLSARYLEDVTFRAQQEREAMLKTLGFIWYLQSELGLNWSVDTTQGYGGWFSNDWKSDPALVADFGSVLDHFPPIPYVREGRRAVGVETLTAKGIYRDPMTKRGPIHSTALALGEYPVDVHGSHATRYLESDLHESEADFPFGWTADAGLFQVPFGVFIPEKVEGVVLAEKNLSVSRIANGAIRLHPITMHTGQAAGAIAALAVKKEVPVREVEPLWVQQQLWRDGMRLVYQTFDDVHVGTPYWEGVQWALLHTAVCPIGIEIFGADLPATVTFVKTIAEGGAPAQRCDVSFVEEVTATRGALMEQFASELKNGTYKDWGKEPDRVLTRGEAAMFFYDRATGESLKND